MDASPFNILPPEVRNRIWDFTVSKPGQVPLQYPPPAWKRDTYLQPPLVRVCKQIRDECLLMFYDRNTFIIEIDARGDWSQLDSRTWEQLRMVQRWATRVNAEYQKYIGKIHFEVFTKYGERVFAGAWWAGARWRLNHRWWEDLVDMLLRCGYAKTDISLCLFGETWEDERDKKWFLALFEEIGVNGGVELDPRAHRSSGFQGELNEDEKRMCFGV